MMRFARKEGGYIGANVVERKLKEGVDIHLVYCEVDSEHVDSIGNEPVYDDDKLIGVTTSGAYGCYTQKSLAFAYLCSGYEIAGTTVEIELLGQRCRARILDAPVWDPDSISKATKKWFEYLG